MGLPYSEKVIDYFMHPRNVGEIDDADAVATEGSPACGDMVKLFLKIDRDSGEIRDIKFKSYGCASNIATASIITEMARGRTVDQARAITWKQASEELGGLPPAKVHCAVLAVDALKTAIENYEHRTGLLKEKNPTDIGIIRKRLSRVINPLTGIDIVKADFLRNITLENGVVTVWFNLDSDHQFAPNIREEIIERLEPLWDIESVSVIFNDEADERR